MPSRSSPAEKDYDTRATESRHQGDIALRNAGFRIHARPEGCEPTWEKGGKLYAESEAHEQVSTNGAGTAPTERQSI